VRKVDREKRAAGQLPAQFGHNRHQRTSDRWLVTKCVGMPFDAVLRQKIDEQQASLVDAFSAGAERPPHGQFHGRRC
jgi:hypothetical protein